MRNRSRVTVYLDPDLLGDIKVLAAIEGRSVANYVERMLLGSEELDDDLRGLQYRREHPAAD